MPLVVFVNQGLLLALLLQLLVRLLLRAIVVAQVNLHVLLLPLGLVGSWPGQNVDLLVEAGVLVVVVVEASVSALAALVGLLRVVPRLV